MAFVLLRSGVLLIDAQGVLLDPPPQAQFAFPVLSGVREDETEASAASACARCSSVQEDSGYWPRTSPR